MSIEQRIEQLERHNRRMRIAVGGLVLVVLGGCVLGTQSVRSARNQDSTKPRVVTASGFVLVDDEGRPRAMLAVSADFTGLVLIDKEGRGRATFGMESGGAPMVSFTSKNGADVLTMLEGSLRLGRDNSKEGSFFFTNGARFTDENGITRLFLGVVQNKPQVSLLDQHENPRAVIAPIAPGTVALSILDKHHKVRAVVGEAVSLFDEKGRQWATFDQDVRSLVFLNESGNMRSVIGEQGLMVRDENGQSHTRVFASGVFLLDKKTTPRASLFRNERGTLLLFSDENAKPRAVLGPGGLMLKDATGKKVWSTP